MREDDAEVDAAREADAEADAMRESRADAAREADAMLDTGFVLRSHRGRTWGAHLMLPIFIGWLVGDGISGMRIRSGRL